MCTSSSNTTSGVRRNDVAEQPGKTPQQAGKRRISIGHGAADQRDSMKQAGQVVEQSSAQFDHLVVRERLEERVQCVGPQGEGGAGRERISLRHQARHLRVSRQELSSEAALADAGLAEQQHNAEAPLPRSAQLTFQRGDLSSPPSKLGDRA